MSSSSADSTAERIVIIGGGFSGSMVAYHLSKLLLGLPVQIVIVERATNVGPGLAYSTPCEQHLLNVRAGNMSAFPDQPGHFLNWLTTHSNQSYHSYTGQSFVPRKIYGEYLKDILKEPLDRGAIHYVRGEAISINRLNDDTRFEITLADNTKLAADMVVVATGNILPQTFFSAGAKLSPGAYFANPWNAEIFDGISKCDSILLIGSGLTAADVIVEADARGFTGKFITVSRHGMLPKRHEMPPQFYNPTAVLTPSPDITLREYLQRLREQMVSQGLDSQNWRLVIDALRPITQDLWQSLNDTEKRRFLRHVSSYWDVHRHRIAPQIHDRVQALIAEGRLEVRSAKVVGLFQEGEKVKVDMLPRGEDELESVTAARVINCSGPSKNFTSNLSPLLKSLLDRKMIKVDTLQLGLEVSTRFELIDSSGQTNTRLFALGPLLKGQLWETIAVPELRIQAPAVAEQIAIGIRCEYQNQLAV